VKVNFSSSNVFIRNIDGRHKNVLMLPVTRSNSHSQQNWQNTLKLLNTRDDIIIVIIDKTPDLIIYDYCKMNYTNFENNLYVLGRPRTESIFTSQSSVTLDRNLWITQMHDDDTWVGTPFIPHDANPNDVFVYNLSKSPIAEFESKIQKGNLPTQEVIFGAIPGIIWNVFSEYVKIQGEPAADSLDSTLYLLCDVFGHIRVSTDFTYSWSAKNWTVRRKAISNLRESTNAMGWGKHSGVNASLIHRALDQISAYSFSALRFEMILSKDDIEYTLLRFNLLNPLGVEKNRIPKCIQFAMSSSRDVTNPLMRIVRVIKFLTQDSYKISKIDTTSKFILGFVPITDKKFIRSDFVASLEGIKNPIFRRKLNVWQREFKKITYLLQN
jgi:hypothetical protein